MGPGRLCLQVLATDTITNVNGLGLVAQQTLQGRTFVAQDGHNM